MTISTYTVSSPDHDLALLAIAASTILPSALLSFFKGRSAWPLAIFTALIGPWLSIAAINLIKYEFGVGSLLSIQDVVLPLFLMGVPPSTLGFVAGMILKFGYSKVR
ncbi:SadB/YajI family lipoprotein [Sandaracinobacteroides hominis]|uniref:hypothetical protein n=1 Tax=Sandaracinobacteroides hominis TaxID=2780086 RepID=UPI0018F6E107|nr:hypothetical protein [Sandaracinobacteroides hominis]